MIYNIKNLSCSYSTSVRPVLEIEQLQIENGDRVFFIGPSGVGKSTILESLGLMNNTIQENSNSVFDFLGESFIDIWDKGEAELKKKRNENFSFIFQSNNLFGSMTGYQNVISGSIINGEHEISSLKRKAAIIVGELLSDLNIKNGEDFNIFEMSGGQKQRVAFARAIIANKDILFADEPTGNLDWYNAEKLMMYLDEKLGIDKTAIIVTHDIELALKFATKIVLIDKKCELINGEENYYGMINANSIYSKNDNTWTNASEDKTLEKVRSEIRSKFIPENI
tara:strand:- start:854 stop:1696 length:843 start_codon:yes stop_codon:yes gene_type:complete